MRIATIALTIVFLAVPALAAGQGYAIQGIENYFSVDSQTATAGGGPVVVGYVHNRSGYTAERVRVAVEPADATGQGTGAVIGQIAGTVPPYGAAYFEIRVPQARAYRVRVLSWDPIGRGQ